MSQHEHRAPQDGLSARFISIAQHILVVIFGLLPILFIPIAAAPFNYSKTLVVVVGVFCALLAYGLAILRSGTVRFHFSWAPMLLWMVVLVALVSALLSGDFHGALMGETLGVQTVGFVALLALVATTWMILGTDKLAIVRLFMLLALSTLILAVFHLLRIVVGAETLTLGFLSSDPTFSPFGGWNDLAIFFGLAIVLSLVALGQLALTRLGRAFFAVVVAAALIMLAVINFFAVWVVLGLISLVVLIYSLVRDQFSTKTPSDGAQHAVSSVSVGTSLVVFIASLVFVVGGSAIGNTIGSLTNIEFIEVRPSVTATADIVSSVYGGHALFGVGPNHFIDAWRQHKDMSINTSVFWETNFNAGFGYIPTFFATTGIIGGLVWLAFLGFFLVTGMRMLLAPALNDRTWYFIGTVAFVGGLYIWVMTIVYVPGPALLLLAALCTGLVAASHGALVRTAPVGINGYGNRRMGFIMVLLFLVATLIMVGVLYLVGRHYASVYVFNSTSTMIARGATIDEVEQRTVQAYALSPQASYARRLAEYQLARMEQLLASEDASEADQQAFSDALQNGLNAAQVAISQNGRDPRNWSMLGNLYAALIPADVEGAADRATEAFERAQVLDPRNPAYLLTLGQIAYAAGREAVAREYAERALDMKPNYSDAIFFFAQMDIAAGDTASAIDAARAVTTLEPQNPVRFFQLGILQYSAEQYAAAATSLERAVALNREYANARYYLALVYDALERTDDARSQLNAILELNPGNALVIELLGRLDSGAALVPPEADGRAPVGEESGISEDDAGSVRTSTPPDTPLVSPVNTPPASSEGGEAE